MGMMKIYDLTQCEQLNGSFLVSQFFTSVIFRQTVTCNHDNFYNCKIDSIESAQDRVRRGDEADRAEGDLRQDRLPAAEGRVQEEDQGGLQVGLIRWISAVQITSYKLLRLNVCTGPTT